MREMTHRSKNLLAVVQAIAAQTARTAGSTEAFAEANRAVKEAADKARRASILTGFVTAASLMVSFGRRLVGSVAWRKSSG